MDLSLYLTVFTCIIISSAADDSKFMADEKRLYKDLMAQVNPYVRPVNVSSEKLIVKFGISLLDIINVDEKANMITTQVWLRKLWQDYQLKWDPSKYGGVTTIRLPIDKIWKPDITLYNSAQKGMIHYQETMAAVYNSGDVLWIPPVVMKSRCHFDLTDFPFDTQRCRLKFGSWVYDGNAVGLDFYEGKESMDLSDYQPHYEWDVANASAKVNVVFYPCCPDVPYPDLSFDLVISRKSSVFSVLSVTPFILLAILCPVVFLFPYSETQRFSLGGSILICLILLLTTFEELVPASTGRVPKIAQYYISVLVLLVLSLIFSAVILNLAGRKYSVSGPPQFLKVILVDYLGRILCVSQGAHDTLIENETNQGTSKRGYDEWWLIAQALDRLFFVLYVILTIIVTLAFSANL